MSATRGTLRGQRVFVTGGTGFIGSAVVRRAIAEGAEVSVLMRPDANRWRLAEVEGHYARVPGTLAALRQHGPAGRADLLIHCAAHGVDQRVDDPATQLEVNVNGTFAAVEHAHRLDVQRMIHLGSSGEYGPGASLGESAALQPTSLYGATRAAATLLARRLGARYNVEVVVVRPFAVYGPFEAAYRLVPYSILRALRAQPVELSSGAQTRDFLFLDDAVDGIVAAATTHGIGGGTFNLCTGHETAVSDLAHRVAAMMPKPVPVQTGIRPHIPGEMWRTVGDPRLAASALGWRATTALDAGLDQTIQWFRQVGLQLPAYAGLE